MITKQKFTEQDITKMIENERCIIFVKKKVYDITDFINKHPGGSNSLLNKVGEDCAVDFNYHSKNGKKLWDKYKIGYLHS